MNILFHSNLGLQLADGTEFGVTGYANQTGLIVPRLHAAGHKMTTSSFYGLDGSPLKIGDIWHYPHGRDAYGNDVLAADALNIKADIVITLMDVWVLRPEATKAVRWCPYLPVDHDPLPPMVRNILQTAYQPIAYSKFGETKLKEAGLNPLYVPHGVDTKKLYPVDRAQARKALGCPEDKFLVGIVAANKGFPSRKCFDQQIRAFARLYDKHRDAMLYLHTDLRGQANGENIQAIVEMAGLPPDSVAVVDQYQYNRGMLTSEYMRNVYGAMDVLTNCSRGEGFGIPILEAQACGTPVIVTDFSSMSELCFDGWLVPYTDRVFSQDSYQVSPDTNAIYEAMQDAYNLGEKGCAERGERAMAKAIEYDIDKVVTDYWLPALAQIEARIKDETTKWNAALANSQSGCKDGHDWAKMGVWDYGSQSIPCRRKGCPAELRITDGVREERPTGFEMVVNGEYLDIEDDPEGGVSKVVWREIFNSYRLDAFTFEKGDVVLDIGAQVGVVSVYLAKRWPDIEIWAYEPMPMNYARLLRNIEANGITNIRAVNKGLSRDGKPMVLKGNPASNTGGYSAFVQGKNEVSEIAPTITLEQALDDLGDKRAGLIKIDCEGAEYEILTAKPDLLKRVDWLVGEFHYNRTLTALGYNPDRLKQLCESYLGGGHVIVTNCQIAD